VQARALDEQPATAADLERQGKVRLLERVRAGRQPQRTVAGLADAQRNDHRASQSHGAQGAQILGAARDVLE
jgi:hypothetical protein